MRILFSGFWCNSGRVAGALHHACKQRGITAVFAVESREMELFYRDNAISYVLLRPRLQERFRHWKRESEASVTTHFDQLFTPNKSNLVHYYIRRFSVPAREARQLLLSYADVYRDLVDPKTFATIVNFGPFPPNILLADWFNANGRRSLLYYATLAKGKVFFNDNYVYRRCFRCLDEKRYPPDLAWEEAQRTIGTAWNYLKSLYLTTDPKRIARRFVVNTWKDHARDYVKSGRFNDFIPLPYYIKQQFEQYWVKPWKEKFYQQPVAGERYYYFPFGSKDEFKHIFTWPHTYRQIDYAAQVADALPPGCKLYVKEHPWYAYPFPVDWAREIAEHPRIRLINPRVPSFELQQGSEGVVAFTSDALWEGVFFGKKVAALTPFLTTDFGLNYPIDSRAPLGPQIAAFVGAENAVPKRQLVRYLQAWFSSLYPDNSEKGDATELLQAILDAHEDRDSIDYEAAPTHEWFPSTHKVKEAL